MFLETKEKKKTNLLILPSHIFEFEEKILPYLGNCEVVDLYVLHYFIQKSVSH